MLKNTVLRQKEDKERLLSLSYIERSKTQEAKKWVSSDLIKVILGPRRAGKSVFSLMLLKGQPFAYFNFDDEALAMEEKLDLDELMTELRAAYGETKTILFDEIQNLPKWELFVNRLHREGYNLVLTGSNANLLSMELATHLTGRHIPIEILPFDFKEFMRAKKFEIHPQYGSHSQHRGEFLNLLTQYMTNGGYPEVVIGKLEPRGYLATLFDSLLLKDVVQRHRVRSAERIDSLGSYLVNNFTGQYTIRKLVNVLNFKSGITLEKYLSYLTQSYIMFPLSSYSAKAGERLRSPKKIYVVDNGFVTAKAVQFSANSGKFMENLVFTELVKRGNESNRDLFCYKTRNDKKVDFVLKQGTEVVELIQVSYDLSNSDVEQREVRALAEAADELKVKKLTVLTWDNKREVKKDDKTIHFKPLWEWLIEKS